MGFPFHRQPQRFRRTISLSVKLGARVGQNCTVIAMAGFFCRPRCCGVVDARRDGASMLLNQRVRSFALLRERADAPRFLGCTLQMDPSSVLPEQCNNLIDHLNLIGITRIFTLRSMSAMLRSPPPPPPSPRHPSILGCSAPLRSLHLPGLLLTA